MYGREVNYSLLLDHSNMFHFEEEEELNNLQLQTSSDEDDDDTFSPVLENSDGWIESLMELHPAPNYMHKKIFTRDNKHKNTYSMIGLTRTARRSDIVLNMLKAKKIHGTKKGGKYIGPMTVSKVTESHALVLKEGSDSKLGKYPLHLTRQYVPRSEAKSPKRKCTDVPTDVVTKKFKEMDFIEKHLFNLRVDELSHLDIHHLESDNPIITPITTEWQKEKCNLLEIQFQQPTDQHSTMAGRRTRDYEPWKCSSIERDGNCLFRCLSKLISGSQEYHAKIRGEICRYMQDTHILVDGNEYKAYWSDIQKLYEIDRATPIRLTKLTHTAVYLRPLQRQSVPLVCQVFNDKTVAALKTFKGSLGIGEGTIILTQTMRKWFKIINVRDRFSAIRLRNESRQPWTADCTSFTWLEEACQIISTSAWQGGGGHKLKLTKQTTGAFTVSTLNNVDAAKLLLADKDFDYILPAIFADEALEKFSAKPGKRRGGNFYIDVVDIMAADKFSRMLDCDKNCTTSENPAERSEFIDESTTQDTQEL
ncbi:hypothetical protein LOD99_4736 [Oopsacas minuta]|uniref:OTU domain-containing protein n=1 Tax=Oopsacas minuta TaxID=111878 RepID=A0AAV7JSA4_9METZ|nr:hypothetical protein LOD99_4736 [Oopsacas minuta]